MRVSGSGFDWFTGLASIALPCPPDLQQTPGLRRFFGAPNHPRFGVFVPRILMHESLHAFQLAGSRWLQRMVAEEWQRVLTLERTGVAPPMGPLRKSWGRPPPGLPFSVRDLVECLARFWDVHIRGPQRVIAEHGARDGADDASDGPDGETSAAPLYDEMLYEAAIRAGQKLDSYPLPYLRLQLAAFHSPAVASLGAEDPARNRTRASWATQLLLPIIGFAVLNTDDPVRAFVIAMDAVLADPEGLRIPTAAENTWRLVELDWLACWAPLVGKVAATLKGVGLPVQANPRGLVGDEAWGGHPVWRLHAGRSEALLAGLRHLATEGVQHDPQRPWLELQRAWTSRILEHSAFAAMALMGVPDFRAHLGAAFAPPLLRFDGTSLPATATASPRAPWPVDGSELEALVLDAARRHRVLRDADVAAKFGSSRDAFARPGATPAPDDAG